MAAQALLVMDVQRSVVARLEERAQGYLARIGTLVAAARAARVPLIHVVVRFRDGHPEISPDNKAFAGLLGTDTLTESHPMTAIHPALEPRPEEPVVAKRFFGAFSGTDLDTVLRARGIDTLVLAGLATSGVVLGTLREATERQYRQIVLSDACDDLDLEVHRILLERVFPREADVVTIGDWIKTLPQES
ncbi:isochorismatase family cysteine hydrolase [Streptomyces sp. FXJ1.172]|uniref:cysteine hydrolase family protein n=1 Tax=Streptomyces sp. FXJ1.172 TaxID=710705 RepID=UPI0007CF99D3|nr:isochorismatase family cysteine hydrolase [Streptomyces sp. FXJ1.172]WEO99504.1 cysteine hydrolase [Streptomyces sp. FXJ1.172]